MLGLGHLLRRQAPRLSTTGVVLGVLGAFGHTVFGGISMVYVLMAGDTARRAAYAALYAHIETSPVMLFSLIGLAGTVLGLLLLAIAMFRTAVVPRWVPACSWPSWCSSSPGSASAPTPPTSPGPAA